MEYWKQLIFNILFALCVILYTLLTFLNPGIVINSKKGMMHSSFCKKCLVYFQTREMVEHCFDCDVCLKDPDHHCSVFRKCITKKNFWIFVGIIVDFLALYVYSVIFLVIYLIDKYGTLKRKS